MLLLIFDDGYEYLRKLATDGGTIVAVARARLAPLTGVIGPTGVSQGSGGSTQDYQFRLIVFDPKSRTVLWAFSEHIPQSGNRAKNRQFSDQTMGVIVDDLKKLSGRGGTGS